MSLPAKQVINFPFLSIQCQGQQTVTHSKSFRSVLYDYLLTALMRFYAHVSESKVRARP